MSTIRDNLNFTFRDIPKLLAILLGIFIIGLFFPSHGESNKIYQQGGLWNYEDLFVKQDFVATVSRPAPDGSNNSVESLVSYGAGTPIVTKNQVIDNASYQAIEQYYSEIKTGNSIFSSKGIIYFLGYLLLTALIIGALILYAIKYFPEICKTFRGVLFILFWPVFFSALIYLVTHKSGISPYMIPFCIVPIIVFNFFGGRLALLIHIVVILICSFLSELGYEFTFLQILAGIITVLIVSETRYWNRFFQSILVIMLTYLLGFLGLALINSGSLVSNEYPIFGWLVINALLLLLAYPLIPLVERMFGFTSSITLAELADMNNKLLREMSIKAPGTLQHSLQVSNLAEAATDRIGANSLLVKTAALYHDIGKMVQPELFIENSKGVNHHEKLNNFESAKVIIDHVNQGEIMAKKAGLPKLIIDFITSHHGTTRVEYFYRNQKSAEPDKEFDESLFRYPGPKPVTKEQTILMIADSLEAASKSLKSPTGQDIDKLVDKIVAYKIDQEQLSDSQLSFNELEQCTTVFKQLLRNINHVRVEYPDENPES